ncbi:hypothetical protein BC941DRAFT_456887 [Chlamydoabsidia padenii]|nr:hypothetical protein BC941DRAFT_456887 [Chlamydoabsidia padenii]
MIADAAHLPTFTSSPSSSQQQQQQLDPCPSSRALSQFYRGLATQNLDQLWPLYSTIYQNNLHTRLTRQNYRQLVLVTARSAKTQRNLHRLLAIIEDMQQLAHPLRLSDYNMIIYWLGGATVPETRPRHLTDALGWLNTMKSSVEPCVVTYNTLIHVASQANDLLTAQRLYHAMLAKGIHPDTFTYTTLLHCMAFTGDIQGALEQQQQQHTGQTMTAAPVADVTTFQIYIDYLIRQNRQGDAIHILLDTMLTHLKMRPNITIYNRLFASFTARDKDSFSTRSLQQLYTSLKQQSYYLRPNSDTLESLVTALLNQQEHTLALRIFMELSQRQEQDSPSPSPELLERLSEVLQDLPSLNL